MSVSNLSSGLPHLQPLIVERTRLLEKLRAAAHHKLTLIAAPPGYGKSTLVTQFAHETTLPVAWHWLEENERDLPNLFEHCLTALSDIAPEILTNKPEETASAAELASFMTDFLRRELDGDFIYILDDVHHLI